jgi:hypothetical protein
MAGLEARAKDGDPDARAQYLRVITGQAELEGQQVSDYDLVRQGRRLNGTVAELAQAGAYGGDAATIAKSFANADVDDWLNRHPDVKDADEEAFIMRASASILERAQNEGWSKETTRAALETGLTRAMNQRAIHRGVRITGDVVKTIGTIIAPHIRFMLDEVIEGKEDFAAAIQSYRETQY